jgi:hypothetical protein
VTDAPLDVLASLVRGALELERTDRGLLPHRLPAWARAQSDDPQLHLVEAQPAGVRLVLRTTATRLALDVLPTKRRYVGAPARPTAGTTSSSTASSSTGSRRLAATCWTST